MRIDSNRKQRIINLNKCACGQMLKSKRDSQQMNAMSLDFQNGRDKCGITRAKRRQRNRV